MKYKRLGASLISLAAACAIVLPATVSTAFADSLSTASVLDIAAMEKYYASVLASDAVMNPAITDNKMFGEYVAYWSDKEIDPNFDNVTVSYDYTRLTNNNIPFGFRFTLAGNKHVALYRFTARETIARLDDGTDSDVNVKLYAPEDFGSIVVNETVVNALPTNVNTGEYTVVPKPTDSTKEGINVVSDGLFRVHTTNLSDGAAISIDPWTIALKKVTTEDGVQFRYYENGNFVCGVEFEDEVLSFAPASVDYKHTCNKFENFKVTLGQAMTEYDEAHDEIGPEPTATLAVGEEMSVDYKRTVQQLHWADYPAIHFGYGEGGEYDGVMLQRYSARWAARAIETQFAKSNTGSAAKKDVWFTSGQGSNSSYDQKSWYVKKDYATYFEKKEADVAKWYAYKWGSADDVGFNYLDAGEYYATYMDRVANYNMHIIIRRNENKTDNNVTYAMYTIYENAFRGEDFSICTFGFPVTDTDKGATIHFTNANHAGNTLMKNFTTTQLAALKSQAEATPAEREECTDTFTQDYAQTKDSSVRFAADTQGLRFTASADKKLIQAYQAAYGKDNVEFGVKLVRGDGAYAFICANNFTEKEDAFTFNGVVTNIAAANYGVKYTPYVYIKYTDTERVEHVVLTAAGEAKSISEVCAATLADVSDVKEGVYVYEVTLDGTTVYSRYSQAKIDVLKSYIVE